MIHKPDSHRGARIRKFALSDSWEDLLLSSPVWFVLVGTQTPGNLGAVCRVAAAFGFPAVRVVRPEFAPLAEEARWLAHGAEDVLRSVTVHDSLTDALRGCSRSTAATARPRNWNRPVRSPAEAAQWLPADGAAPLAVVFGPEDRGLTNEDLAQCDEVLSISLPEDAGATLSLPASASIVAWELARASSSLPTRSAPRSVEGARPLDSGGVDQLLDEIHTTLDEIGFRPKPNAVRFRGSLRDFLARAQPTEGDRRLLRHLFAQIGKWKRRVLSEARRGIPS